MIGGVLFLVGLIGLVVFGAFLLWESRKGVRTFAALRARCDRGVSTAYRTLVFGEIPHVYRTSLIHEVRKLTHKLVHALVLLLRAVERPLARMSQRMRHMQGATTVSKRTPSPFLKDITSEKKGNGEKPENQV